MEENVTVKPNVETEDRVAVTVIILTNFREDSIAKHGKGKEERFKTGGESRDVETKNKANEAGRTEESS